MVNPSFLSLKTLRPIRAARAMIGLVQPLVELKCSEKCPGSTGSTGNEGSGGVTWKPNGCFLKWWYPPFHTPKWTFLVGKLRDCWGNHHFRKHPNWQSQKKTVKNMSFLWSFTISRREKSWNILKLYEIKMTEMIGAFLGESVSQRILHPVLYEILKAFLQGYRPWHIFLSSHELNTTFEVLVWIGSTRDMLKMPPPPPSPQTATATTTK